MTELYKLRTSYEESQDQIEIVRKENKTLSGDFTGRLRICQIHGHFTG